MVFKTSYALFIIILMVIGVVAGAFYFYTNTNQNPCGTPGPIGLGSVYHPTIGGQTYTAVDVNFTSATQDEVLPGVTFTATAFNDPSQPHLVNGNCASDTFTPATVTLQLRFSGDNVIENLQTISFKGTAPSIGPILSTHTSPQAGVEYQAGNSFVTLLVSA